MTVLHTTTCQRARALVSQGLDAPLHDLEQRLVTSHVSQCGVCRTFRADAEAFTQLLRDAPGEQLRWPISVQTPRRLVRVRALAQIASAASVLVIAGSVSLGNERPWRAAEASHVGAALTDAGGAEQAIRVLRREALSEGSLQVLPATAATPTPSSTAPAKPALDSETP